MKRSWEKPEMIVLLRRKSDELILAGCKDSSGTEMNKDTGCLAFDQENLCIV